jgi:L-ascorbate metabolism protein UlaG (beta-lactamase superfamily)
MRRIILPIMAIGIATLLVTGCAATAEPSAAPVSPTAELAAATPTSDLPASVGRLHWFGMSAILYHGSKNVYFDPYMLEGNLPSADFILISHEHAEHAHLASLKKIIGPGTILIISPNVQSFCQENAHEIGVEPVILKVGESAEFGDVKIDAVLTHDTYIHDRSTEGAGFVVSVDGERIYFAGGTMILPEMADIVSDVTLYNWYFNSDVLAVAEILQTKVLIPLHTSEPGAKAFADVYAGKITRLKIVALELGPYNP